MVTNDMTHSQVVDADKSSGRVYLFSAKKINQRKQLNSIIATTSLKIVTLLLHHRLTTLLPIKITTIIMKRRSSVHHHLLPMIISRQLTIASNYNAINSIIQIAPIDIQLHHLPTNTNEVYNKILAVMGQLLETPRKTKRMKTIQQE